MTCYKDSFFSSLDLRNMLILNNVHMAKCKFVSYSWLVGLGWGCHGTSTWDHPRCAVSQSVDSVGGLEVHTTTLTCSPRGSGTATFTTCAVQRPGARLASGQLGVTGGEPLIRLWSAQVGV